MRAWGNRRTEGAPYVVDQLFWHLHKHAPHSVTTHSYNLRLQAWAVSTAADAAPRCEALLAELQNGGGGGAPTQGDDGQSQQQQQQQSQLQEIKPNVHSYNACIKAWIRSASPAGVERASQLIRQMQETYRQTNDIMVAPGRRTYNLLLYGLAHSDQAAPAASRALEIFEFMRNSPEPFCQPNGNTFHQVMLCLARNDGVAGFEDVLEETFQTCLSLAAEREIEIYADTVNVYMSGWLKSEQPSSVGLRHILEALQMMEDSVHNESPRNNDHDDDDDNQQRLRRLMSVVAVPPNRVTMNTVLAAHVKFSGRDAITHMQNLRKRMESTYGIYPDTTTYNTMIDAHAKSQRPSADTSAFAILRSMERHLVKGKRRARPDAYTYCTVIDCLAKSSRRRDTGVQSLQMLDRMIELHKSHRGEKPNLVVYNSVLNSMAAASPVDIKSVETLLRKMENSDTDDLVTPKPSIVTYNSAFKAALRSGIVEGAEWADSLLKSLEERASSAIGGDQNKHVVKPDSFTYTTVIAAFGKSPHNNKAAKAAELVERAIHAHHSGFLQGNLTISVFNAACNACCFVHGEETEKRHAFATLTTISALLTNYTRPDATTYGTLLRACSQLLPKGQTKQQAVARQIFRKACEDGLCGEFVLKQIRFAATPGTYKELLGFDLSERIGIESTPYTWRRNVQMMKR